MEAPSGVTCPDGHLLLLNKALYGLKQSPRQFNTLLDDFIQTELKFAPLLSDKCVYQKRSKSNHVILLGIFVDDILVSVNNQDQAEWLELKSRIQHRFSTKDLGELSRMLGMQIDQSAGSITISQQDMIDKLVDQHGLSECKPTKTPEATGVNHQPHTGQAPAQVIKSYQSVIGSLTYICYATRPDLTHAVNTLSRYSTNPSKEHFVALKRILKYLRGTSTLALHYVKSDGPDVITSAYTDADWGGDQSTRRSVSGNVIKLNQNTVVWRTKRQTRVSASTSESEYLALAEGVKDVEWLQNFLFEITKVQHQVKMYCDNQATIHMVKNDSHFKARHLDISAQFVNSNIMRAHYSLTWCPSEDMQADIMTKATGEPTFARMRSLIMNVTSQSVTR